MTPAERSNSPPIISRATTTAGMPIVDATSVQFEMPSSFRNSAFWVQKKIATTMQASSAPISGRRNSRAIGLIFASRSSPAGTGGPCGGATSAVVPAGAPLDGVVACLSITFSPRARAGMAGVVAGHPTAS